MKSSTLAARARLEGDPLRVRGVDRAARPSPPRTCAAPRTPRRRCSTSLAGACSARPARRPGRCAPRRRRGRAAARRARRVRHRPHQLGVLAPAAPGRERHQDARRDRHMLVLHAVAVAVHVRVLVRVGRGQHPLPRPHLLVDLAPDHHHGVQPQVLAERLGADARARQQHRRVQRAAGADHRARPHGHPVPVGGARLHAARRSALDRAPAPRGSARGCGRRRRRRPAARS